MEEEGTQIIEESPVEVKKRVNVSTIPSRDIDFLTVAKNVCNKWLANPNYVLVHTNPQILQQLVDEYDAILSEKISIKVQRPEVTNKLRQCDKKINTGVKYIKLYLTDKYGAKNVAAQYSKYGIVKAKYRWIVPTDRDVRRQSLQRILNSLQADGFGDKQYGLAYWSSIITAYEPLLAQARLNDAQVSMKSSSKNIKKKQIKKILNCLIYLIKANNPGSYKSALRQWGFHKEKY